MIGGVFRISTNLPSDVGSVMHESHISLLLFLSFVSLL